MRILDIFSRKNRTSGGSNPKSDPRPGPPPLRLVPYELYRPTKVESSDRVSRVYEMEDASGCRIFVIAKKGQDSLIFEAPETSVARHGEGRLIFSASSPTATEPMLVTCIGVLDHDGRIISYEKPARGATFVHPGGTANFEVEYNINIDFDSQRPESKS